MTEQQRKAIRILNRIRQNWTDKDEQMLSDDDYFFLMSFVICQQQQVEYVPIYPMYPTFPPTVDPYYQFKYTTTTDLKDNEHGQGE